MTPDSPIYRKAFEKYLRKGIAPEISIKAALHQTPYYVWRTQEDDKVRAEHAANDGKVFAWDNPPPTGNPGDTYGCRCWAEPYYKGIVPAALLYPLTLLIHALRSYLEQESQWDNFDMSLYFYVGGGQAVTLDKLGYFDIIKNYYQANYFERFTSQIARNASSKNDGDFSGDFSTSYNFKPVVYSYGNSSVAGTFNGQLNTLSAETRVIKGTANIAFSDVFKDPINLAEDFVRIRNAVPGLEKITEEQLRVGMKQIANLGGTPYSIRGNWQADVNIQIH